MATILLADDEDVIRRLIRAVLCKEGHAVIEARDGKEAVELYANQGADLVITDMMMPVKAGRDTIAELKRHNPAVRIIAMSGGGRVGPETMLSDATLLGAHRVIAKPFDLSELRRAVQEMLGA